jgi:hypothetical protein
MNRSSIFAANSIFASFLLNLVWENAQAPFYAGYAGFWQHFIACFRGALGDVLIIATLYGLFAFWHRDARWVLSSDAKSARALAFAGMVAAVLIEYWALSVGRWAYAPTMPLFLWTRAGLWPVLQMTILPYAVWYFSRRQAAR